MLTEFDTSLPSIRQVQNLIRETSPVEIKLITGDILSGTISWQDPQCIMISNSSNERITIWKQAIAFIKTSA